MGRVAQSVQRLVTSWTVRGSNPGAGEIFRTCPDRPWVHPAFCTMGTGSFPGVRSGRGVTLTPHPLLVPWSRKSRAITLLPLWAVRPVQSLSAWQGCTLPLLLLSIIKWRNRSIVNVFVNDITGSRNARYVTTFVKYGETRQTMELVRNANRTDFCFGQTRQSKCPAECLRFGRKQTDCLYEGQTIYKARLCTLHNLNTFTNTTQVLH